MTGEGPGSTGPGEARPPLRAVPDPTDTDPDAVDTASVPDLPGAAVPAAVDAAAGPGVGPAPLWGLAQVRAYTGVSKETARTWWQAARRRAADPGAAAAADALPAPDFLVSDGDGPGRGFFAPTGGRRGTGRDPWWNLPGRVRPLWRPDTIALWAATTGRAVRTGGALSAEYRLPVPMWTDLPALAAPLPRVLDELVTITARGLAPGPVHVRIFDGPARPAAPAHGADGPGAGAQVGERTVVVLAAPDGGHVAPTVWAAEIAGQLHRTGQLSTAQARRAWWFAVLAPEPHLGQAVPQAWYAGFALSEPGHSATDPATDPGTPGPLAEVGGQVRLRHRLLAALGGRGDAEAGPLHDPQLQPAALSDIDHLIGQTLETYPPGSHTAEMIAAFAATQQPVPVPWDPEHLAADLQHLPVLATAADTARTGGDTARAQMLDAAARWVAAIAHDTLALGYRTGGPLADAELGCGRAAVRRVMPEPTAADRDLIEAVLAADRADPADRQPHGPGVVVRDLAALHTLNSELASTPDAPDAPTAPDAPDAAGAAGALAAAVAHALDRLTVQHERQVAVRADLDGWIPARVPTPGPGRAGQLAGQLAEQPLEPGADTRAYLATVSWWGPRPEDRDHAAVLAGLFYPHEQESGGLRHGYDPFGRVVVHAPGAAAFGVAWPVTDHTTDLRHPDHRFTALADGRVDLLPLGADPDTGPDRTAEATPAEPLQEPR